MGENQQLLIQVSLSDLQSIISTEVQKAINSVNKDTVYLTRKEVVNRFKISLRTLDTRVDEGVFKSYGVGRVVLFKLKEVEEAIIRIN